MELQIKSTQKYQEHEEEIIEMFLEAHIQDLGDVIKVYNQEDEMTFDLKNEEATICRAKQHLSIKVNETRVSDYETPYGKMTFEIYGKQIKVVRNPFQVILRYQLTCDGSKQYENIVEVTQV